VKVSLPELKQVVFQTSKRVPEPLIARLGDVPNRLARLGLYPVLKPLK